MTAPQQMATRCVLMRGGTSRAMFFHLADVPPPGPQRDHFLKRAMGTPDPLQIDGLGGSRLVTSKVALIAKSTRPDADVDYTFAQVDVERDGVGYDGNCGNISSAVGPFAIDEGLVDARAPVTTVRIYNTNTDKLLIARVPVANGKARVTGDCRIPGVAAAGAEVLMDYADTVGARTGRLLPTGQVRDTVDLEDGRQIDVSVCDVANPCVFIAAASLGMTGDEMPADITAHSALIDTVGEIQSKIGQRLGWWPDWRGQRLPGLPLAVIVAPPAAYTDLDGEAHAAARMDLRARLVFLGKCHDSMAGTGSMCLAAATRLRGCVAHAALNEGADSGDDLRIGHPMGVMTVRVCSVAGPSLQETRYTALGLTRTARRLMSGNVYTPLADIEAANLR